jgi:serine/threonine protein kinase
MIGRKLSHYQVLSEISRGGMGIVYRALDLNLEREVALRVLPPGLVFYRHFYEYWKDGDMDRERLLEAQTKIKEI